jgi:hypothetical protein
MLFSGDHAAGMHPVKFFGRFAHRNVYPMIHTPREFPHLRHGCAEEQILSFGRNKADDANDIDIETHVEHFICFIENKTIQLVEPLTTHTKMTQQTPGRGDNYRSSFKQCFLLAIKHTSIAATIDSNGTGMREISKALEGLVNLLSQLTGWSYN